MVPLSPLSPTTVVETSSCQYWTAEEDARLLAAVYLKGKVLDRVDRTIVGNWGEIATEMGLPDAAKSARRCSRRWFALNPSNEAARAVRREQNRQLSRKKRALGSAQASLIGRFEAPDLDELLSGLTGDEAVREPPPDETVAVPAVVEALADTDSPLDLALLQMPISESELAFAPRMPRRPRRTSKPRKGRKVSARSLVCNETLDWDAGSAIPPIGKVGLTYTFKATNLDVVYRFWTTRYSKELRADNLKEKHERAHASKLARIRKLRDEWRREWQSGLFSHFAIA